MPSKKTCPRCNKPFECRKDDIHLCGCNLVKLTSAEIAYIGRLFSECLCNRCLVELKEEYARTGIKK